MVLLGGIEAIFGFLKPEPKSDFGASTI